MQASRAPTMQSAPGSVYRMTNFYPLYGSDNDQVDSVSPIRALAFQKVIPRYRLSTSETRDQGTGPALEEISSSSLPVYPRNTQSPARVTARAPLPPLLGNIVDLFS